MRDKNKLKKLLILFSTGAIILTPVVGVFACGTQKTNSNNENRSLNEILVKTDLGTFAYNATDQTILSRLLTLNDAGDSSVGSGLTLEGNTVSGTITIDGKTYSGSVDITYTKNSAPELYKDLALLFDDTDLGTIDYNKVDLNNLDEVSKWVKDHLNSKNHFSDLVVENEISNIISEITFDTPSINEDGSGTITASVSDETPIQLNGRNYSGTVTLVFKTTHLKIKDISVIQDDLSNLLNKSSMTTTEWETDDLLAEKLGGTSEYKDKTLSELGIDVEKTVHNSETNTYDYIFSGSDDDSNDHPFSGSTSKITHLLSFSTLESKINGTLNYASESWTKWGNDDDDCKALNSKPSGWSRTLKCYGIVAKLISGDENNEDQTWRFYVGTADVAYKQDDNGNLVNDSDASTSGLLASEDDYVEYVKAVVSTTVDLSKSNTSAYQFLSDYVTMASIDVDQQHLLQYVKKLDITTIQNIVDNEFGQGAITVSKGSTYAAESSSSGTRMITFTGTGNVVNGYTYTSSNTFKWTWDDNKEITVDEVNNLMKLNLPDGEHPKYVKTTDSDGNVCFENTDRPNNKKEDWNYVTLGNTDVHTVSATKENGIRYYCKKTRNISWVNKNLFDKDDWTGNAGTVSNNGSCCNAAYAIAEWSYFSSIPVDYGHQVDFEGNWTTTFNMKLNESDNCYFFQFKDCILKFKIKISGYKEFYLNTNLTFNY